MAALAAGHFHTLALTRGGDVWAWGRNGSGQLGVGATAGRGDQCTPQRLEDLAGAARRRRRHSQRQRILCTFCAFMCSFVFCAAAGQFRFRALSAFCAGSCIYVHIWPTACHNSHHCHVMPCRHHCRCRRGQRGGRCRALPGSDLGGGGLQLGFHRQWAAGPAAPQVKFCCRCLRRSLATHAGQSAKQCPAALMPVASAQIC